MAARPAAHNLFGPNRKRARWKAVPQPVVFLAWGRFAQQMVEGKLAATGAGKATGKFCLASTHPSPLSANRATAELPAFMGSRPFSAANRLLEQYGSTPVNWTCIG